MKIYLQKTEAGYFENIKIAFKNQPNLFNPYYINETYYVASSNILHASYFTIFYSFLTVMIETNLSYNRHLTHLGFDMSFLPNQLPRFKNPKIELLFKTND